MSQYNRQPPSSGRNQYDITTEDLKDIRKQFDKKPCTTKNGADIRSATNKKFEALEARLIASGAIKADDGK